MFKNKFKFVFICLLSIIFIMTIFINNQTKKIENNEFSKYISYNKELLPEYELKYLETNNYVYSLNLVNYPNFLNLNNESNYLTINSILLVNPKFYLGESYIPKTLKEVYDVDYIKRENEVMMLDEECLSFYRLMYYDAKENNINLTIFSGYRSFIKQNNLYLNAKDKSFVAKPGYSEHQTGLAIDIGTLESGLTVHFEDTSAFKYLSLNAHRFGFILRYQKGKEQITGYSYEPWHYRYVGIKYATKIYQSNLTLEEYIYQNFEL